jgi:hypothetical protein
MRAGENRVNQSELENRVSHHKSYNDPPRDAELSLGTKHRKQMAPPRVGGLSAVAKKQPKQKEVSPEVEEVARASVLMTPTKFHRDYLPPRADDAPQINLPANAKYPMPVAPVLVGVSSDEDMLRNISNLKFMDHDIMDTQKFLELDRDHYLCTRIILGMGAILVDPHEWASWLQKVGILNLFDIPHFRRVQRSMHV